MFLWWHLRTLKQNKRVFTHGAVTAWEWERARSRTKHAVRGIAKHRKVPRATAVLTALLDEKSWELREISAAALKDIGWEPRSLDERIKFAIALRDWSKVGEYGDAAVPALADALRDPDHHAGRLGAAEALQNIPGAEARALLAFAVRERVSEKHLFPPHRLNVINNKLAAVAEAQDQAVSEAASHALCRHGAAGLDVLAEIVQTAEESMITGRLVRVQVATILAQAGDKRGFSSLVCELEPEDYCHFGDAAVSPHDERKLAALIGIGKPAVEPLLEILSGRPKGCSVSRIVKALGKIGDPRAILPLAHLARHLKYSRLAVVALTETLERSASAGTDADLEAIVGLPNPKQQEVFQPFYYKGEEAAPGMETRTVSVDTSRLRTLADSELQRRRAAPPASGTPGKT